ncbi:hypothetical protein [Flavobacterium hercynium]|uniref:Uncharacterized protein n=1 Tax=Flavobacterium hercynium TaxID=387094 RepID=A0A226HK12_9FLAO|nr:hypothetical protein [Flavobacterium hercynium]OXA94454.1 hypothetical protein B0A66_05190 [Flavobacterium hercynium]SMP29802.1 hypothetical protein SAMN06265346_112128 [Flavobacterium hercynium]
MSTKVPQNQSDQEIDIFDISKSISSFFDRLNAVLFRAIHFFVRNWILALVIVAVGFGLGWYLDKNKKSYDNQIVVSPNFGSVDYLYDKINLLQAKISSGDVDFLKNEVGISDPGAIGKIEIKPITDVYKFVHENKQNLELIKLMAEVGEIKKVLEDKVTSRNYTFHTISFISGKAVDRKNIAEPILKYLNNSEYYVAVQKIGRKNLEQEIAQNDTIIAQIDRVLRSVGNNERSVSQNNKLVYVSDSSPLNDIIETKKKLIEEQGENRIKLIRSDKTIQDVDLNLNINDSKILDGNFKYLLPFFFILIFVFITLFIKFYNSQLSKHKQTNS